MVDFDAALVTLTDAVSTLTSNKWLLALSIFVAFYILAAIFVYVIERYVRSFVKKLPHGDFGDLLLSTTHRPIRTLLLLIGLRLAVVPLALAEKYGVVINRVLDTLVLIVVTYLVIIVTRVILTSWGKQWAAKTKTKLDDQILPLMKSTFDVLLSVIGFLLMLDVWKINIGPFLASLGIAGIAIGFAVKDSIANIFGGIQIVLDRNITVGDAVDIGGVAGSVKDIGMRTTKIRTYDGNTVFYPNAKLAESVIINMNKRPHHRSRFTVQFGVSYDADPVKVETAIKKAAKGAKLILQDPAPTIFFDTFGDSAMTFKVMYWVKSRSDKLEADRALKHNLLKEFKKARIEMPFPTLDINIKK